jgi:hypothetical protein
VIDIAARPTTGHLEPITVETSVGAVRIDDRIETTLRAVNGRNLRARPSRRCSFCQTELGESLELTIPGSGVRGQRGSIGCFCSTHCRNCVLALAALHPSPLASRDFIATRALVTDRLIDLWRKGHGPDPVLVLEAAKRAASGRTIAASAAAD